MVDETRRLKGSDVVEGGELLERLSDFTATTLVARISRIAARNRSYNMTVTNVPGPQLPVDLLGARMEEVYPLVPLFSNQGLGIALKCDDGQGRAAEVMLATLARRFLPLGGEEAAALDDMVTPTLRNWRGTEVGRLRPAGPLAG